ncbi:membrane alanyl aminopeptidase [Manduca sexta]|uniref:membrane alanyl aminopeptidase n=1 Tax=Manduca sexta TaxID=7130 RepID=UPI00188EEB39|nr:membrane alanyl aminopeptidase [Manduca sexta]
MVWDILKWKCAVLYLVTLSVFGKSLPIDTQTANSIITTETAFTNAIELTVKTPEEVLEENVQATLVQRSNFTKSFNITRNTLLRNIRPGQQVRQYVVSITFDDEEFHGRAVIDVVVTDATRGENLVFHFDDVEIDSVQTGVFTIASAVDADFDLDDGILEIEPAQDATSYIVIVEYTGELSNTGRGLYIGEGHDLSYIGMNLHPTNARRVFPCMDDPTEAATVSFTFIDVDYNNIITNSILDDSNTVAGENQFRTLLGPVHTWGMIAHNFINLNIPTTNVLLVGRPGVSNQDAQSSLAINAYFAYFNAWTDMEFFDIVMNQETRLHFLALPDVDREWNTLSTIGIWEPYILMENVASVKQRKTVLVKVAEALARQWFGYVIHPQNWRHEWVVSGFARYSAYEAVRSFQSSATGADVTLLDMNTLFVTDVIQEGLLQDAYTSAPPLLAEEDLFDEDAIRNYIFSVQRWKAPALMHMMRLILGEDDDHDPIQVAARALLTGRALETVSSQNFIDAMSSGLLVAGSDFIDDFEEFLEPWIGESGYPLLHVGLRQGGVLVTQERFSFGPRPHINFPIPITYTTSVNPDFSDDNIRPIVVTDATVAFNMVLDEEDWVLFNIQGQGYYRVNYDGDLWERIIEALEDEELREEIHPLNRATLVDDALNLARAGKLDYDIAFRVVLSMEHETEYAVWKAFVRNMDFLRKRLLALIANDDDDEFDSDIYLRMVRRTIGALEDELGFSPDPLVTEPAMASLTRGLVMDHACRANYDPCIAAAEDWFYDPNNDDIVNPNIPYEIRPAVYCTIVREGDEDVIEALTNRLDLEASQYERVVILEALACSQDEDYISGLLMETITEDKYLTEERVKIFKAVAESSYQNAELAVRFISRRAAEIREWYGGDEKLEEIIFHLADNMADADLSTDFEIFVNSQNNNLEDSQLMADRALLLVKENRLWDDNLLEYVYEWIDENDAPTLAVSLALVGITFIITLFNH